MHQYNMLLLTSNILIRMFFFLGIVYHSVKRNDIPSNPFPVTLRSPQSTKLLMHAKFVINVISISNFKVNNSVLKLLHMWSCAVSQRC